MTLKFKMMISMASTMLCVFLLSYAVGQYILGRGFGDIEEHNAKQHLQRVHAVLADKIHGLDQVLADWAAWDDTCQFVRDRNPAYAKSALVPTSLVTAGLNLVIYLDAAGQTVFVGGTDLKQEVPVPPSLRDAFVSDPLLARHNDTEASVSGVFLADAGPMLVASRPIIRSDRSGPIAGTIIMGRWLDDAAIQGIGRLLLERPTVRWLSHPAMSAQDRGDFARLQGSQDVLVRRTDEDTLSCAMVYPDVHNRPALFVSLALPRDIHRRGHSTIDALLIGLCGAAIVFGLSTLRLVDRQIVSRVIGLDRTARDIARSGDVSRRMEVAGRDELSNLATSFNSMLAELQATQEGLRQAKETAEEASRVKSRFVANVSHEIRTPLNCVIGFSEMILRADRLEATHEHARTILQESEVLLALINNLLDNAKIEAGRMELEHRPFDLREVLAGAARQGKAQARAKQLEVRLEIAEDVPAHVMGDSLRLRQVLMNLVSNAVKFTEKGSVTIVAEVIDRSSPQVPTVLVAVIDTGIGIPKDRQSVIFQSFTQVDAGTTRKYGGTGLGTSIALQLVTLMKGRMGLESEPGRGSTFWFQLPLAVCEEPVGEADLPARAAGSSRSGRILLADDYPANREIIRLLLEDAGHKVTAVENGARLIEAAETGEYDLIVADVQMPEVDGCTAASRIRTGSSACSGVPIIALTADSESSCRDRCREAGMDEVVCKPVRRHTLLPVVDRWLATDPQRGIVSPESLSASQALTQPAESAKLPLDYAEAVREFGNAGVVDRVIAQFLVNIQEQIALMRDALARGEFEIIRREAHAIKGGALTLVAGPLAEAARRVEHAAGEPRSCGDEVLPALETLGREMEQLRAFASCEDKRQSRHVKGEESGDENPDRG